MKKTIIICLFSAILLIVAAYTPQPDVPAGEESLLSLAQQFQAPPVQYRPNVWWHWLGSNFTKEGITKDLEAMKEAGIGGATIFNIASSVQNTHAPIENNPWPQQTFRSSEYWEAMKHTMKEARRLGLNIGLHGTPGYATTGGPWIPEERGMQTIVLSLATVNGNTTVKMTLEKPELPVYRGFTNDKDGEQYGRRATSRQATYYRDVAVMAVPDKPNLSTDDIIDISQYMDSSGLLQWKAPAGVWTVCRIGHAPTMSHPHPLPDDIIGKCLEVDKMSREDNIFHWQQLLDPLKEHIGEYFGNTFTYIWVDSYESGEQDWTPKFREEFQSLKGYDPLPWIVRAKLSDGKQESDDLKKFKQDNKEVISRLFIDNGWKVAREMLHKYGLKLYWEPYWGPFNTRDCLDIPDLPVAEFWTGSSGSIRGTGVLPEETAKLGKRIIGAEAMTGRPELSRYTEDPAFLKHSADGGYVSGSNLYFLHHWVHQPFDDRYQPGMGMGWWGTHFSRFQTWFKPGKAFFAYLGRCQMMLQQGDFVPSGDKNINHHTTSNAELFFVINPDSSIVSKTYAFPAKDLVPELWDAYSGTIRQTNHWQAAGDSVYVDLKLNPDESIFVVFPKDKKCAYEKLRLPAQEIIDEKVRQEMKGWTVLFQPKLDKPFSRNFPELTDFSQSADTAVKYFAGTATYEQSFRLNPDDFQKDKRIVLDLGQLHDIAEVEINGKNAGVLWCPPYKTDITPYLKKGDNRLKIHVTVNWANRLIGDEQYPADFEWGRDRENEGRAMKAFPDWFLKNKPRPTARKAFTIWYYFRKDSPLYPAGLLGPVKLLSQTVSEFPPGETVASLAQQFQAPPMQYRPHVWWHWMGSNFSKDGITKDLEAMNEAGIGGGVIFNLTSAVQNTQAPIENNPWPNQTFRGDAWWDAFKHTMAEAKRLGLTLGLHGTPGYATTGGPWIPEERGMQTLVFSQTTVNGGSRVEKKLDKPELPYYKGFTNEKRGENFGRVPTSRQATFYRDVAVMAAPDKKSAALTDIVDISQYMDSDGVLRWQAPEGVWRIFRIGHAPTMANPHPLPDDIIGKSLEVDKMSREDNIFHWQQLLDPLKEHIGEYFGTTFTYIWVDSYESGDQEWTPKFRDEFQRMKGYDPIPPIILQKFYNEDLQKFKQDNSQVISRLFIDNGWTTARDMLHKYGLKFYWEPYYGPFDMVESIPLADLPVTEIWTHEPTVWHKDLIPKVAQKHGKNIVGVEALTGRPIHSRYTETPAFLKHAVDGGYISGANQYFLNHWTLQPFDDRYQPGISMGWWGTHFGRHQTWFKPAKAFFTYLARCQMLLQQGEFVSSDTKTVTHRTTPDAELFFVINPDSSIVSKTYAFPAKDLVPELWDAYSGTIRQTNHWRAAGDSVYVDLKLNPDESIFVVFPKDKKCAYKNLRLPAQEIIDEKTRYEIEGWKVLFQPKLDAPFIRRFTKLIDFSQSADTEIKYFAGTATYEQNFWINTDDLKKDKRILLDLGELHDIAELEINGKNAGVLWSPPYKTDITPYLKKGDNRLKIHVTVNWANRLIGDEQYPADFEWGRDRGDEGRAMKAFPDWFLKNEPRPSARKAFTIWYYFHKDSPLFPAGLLGPVKLLSQTVSDKPFSMVDAIPADAKPFDFHGFQGYDFTFMGRNAKVVVPKHAAPNRPWNWRARFWGGEPQTDIALLEHGFHIVYCDVSELFGNQEALSIWNEFYQWLQKAGLAKKSSMEGMSRGGVYIYRWAVTYPDRVTAIYADAPVLDLKSWPGGKGKVRGEPSVWETFKKDFGFTTEEEALAFDGNPLDLTGRIVAGGYPMLHVVGDADDVVPVEENTAPFEQKIRAAGGSIQVIHKPGIGHHPHSLKDPKPIVDFILQATKLP